MIARCACNPAGCEMSGPSSNLGSIAGATVSVTTMSTGATPGTLDLMVIVAVNVPTGCPLVSGVTVSTAGALVTSSDGNEIQSLAPAPNTTVAESPVSAPLPVLLTATACATGVAAPLTTLNDRAEGAAPITGAATAVSTS